jgi:hypothetical protein
VAVVFAASLWSGTASGQQAPPSDPASLEGSVLRVDAATALVNLGGEQGIRPGDRVRFFGVEGDPSGSTVGKSGGGILVGSATVLRVADTVSEVRLPPELRGLVRVGYRVVADPTGWVDPDLPAGPGDEVADADFDDEIEDVEPEEPVFRSRRQALPRQPRQTRAQRRASRYEPASDSRLQVVHDPARTAQAGQSLDVVFSVRQPAGIDQVTLHVRGSRREAWLAIPMEPAGDLAFRGTIPAEKVTGRRVEYWIDARSGTRHRVSLFRNARSPWAVSVTAGEALSARPYEVRVTGEWQDFYLRGAGRDSWWHTGLEMAWLPRLKGFGGVRAGVGILEGIGGDWSAVENGDLLSHRAIGYFFFQPEFRFGEWARMKPRFIVGGVYDSCDLCGGRFEDRIYDRNDVILGGYLWMEIGPEHLFNIRFGAGGIETIGAELSVEGTWNVVPGVPVGVGIMATNFPVAEEWGGRLLLITGYRGLDWLSLDVRLSVNLRNIRHAGLGGGLGLSFRW